MFSSELILEICHNIQHNNVTIIKDLFDEIDDIGDMHIQIMNLFVNQAVILRQDSTLFTYFVDKFSSRSSDLDWYNIIMNASWMSHPDSMEYILKYGYVSDMEWVFQNSALFGRLDMIKLYIKYGYKISDRTRTALEMAKAENRTAVVNFLEELGVR